MKKKFDVEYIILKCESYDDGGVEKLKFAVVPTSGAHTNVAFMFDSYALEAVDGEVKATCGVSFLNLGADKDKIALTAEDPRWDELMKISKGIIEDITDRGVNGFLDTESKESV